MEIRQNCKINTHFKSLNNPIKPFKLDTSKGVISFKEIKYDKPPKDKLFYELGTFFLDNFANQSSHPWWKKCRKFTPTFEKDTYSATVKSYKPIYLNAIKNPDTTIMIGRDKNKKIVAAVYSEPLNITHEIKDKNTLYINSIAVNKKYRGNNLGKIMLEKVEESSKKNFTDSFLVAYKESAPFYKKQNYKNLSYFKMGQLFIIDRMHQERVDYPEYASFMSKTLDSTKSRWYKRIFSNFVDRIKNSFNNS